MAERMGTHKSTTGKHNIHLYDANSESRYLLIPCAFHLLTSEQLTLLRILIIWSLSSSETVKGIINASYKSRHEDDLNQPLAVQSWGADGHKRRYYLIEGLDDTSWRIYRESGTGHTKRTWLNIAEDIDELKALAEKLATDDGTKNAKILSNKMLAAIPLFEQKEEVGFFLPLIINCTDSHRNESDENTASSESSNSGVRPSLPSLCMRAEPEAKR